MELVRSREYFAGSLVPINDIGTQKARCVSFGAKVRMAAQDDGQTKTLPQVLQRKCACLFEEKTRREIGLEKIDVARRIK